MYTNIHYKEGQLSVRYMETLCITFTIFLYIKNYANVKKVYKKLNSFTIKFSLSYLRKEKKKSSCGYIRKIKVLLGKDEKQSNSNRI